MTEHAHSTEDVSESASSYSLFVLGITAMVVSSVTFVKYLQLYLSNMAED